MRRRCRQVFRAEKKPGEETESFSRVEVNFDEERLTIRPSVDCSLYRLDFLAAFFELFLLAIFFLAGAFLAVAFLADFFFIAIGNPPFQSAEAVCEQCVNNFTSRVN
jgi:hypothetical protein